MAAATAAVGALARLADVVPAARESAVAAGCCPLLVAMLDLGPMSAGAARAAEAVWYLARSEAAHEALAGAGAVQPLVRAQRANTCVLIDRWWVALLILLCGACRWLC